MNTDNRFAFCEFPKMARLQREVIVTEKIDGTNAQIFIAQAESPPFIPKESLFAWNDDDGKLCFMLAGSRTRWITPESDNFGFAAWVQKNAEELRALGVGRHFGEWWGSGIQRGYGLKEKRLSLFNVQRWCLHDQEPQRIETADPRIEKYQEKLPACVGLVPLLYRGDFCTKRIDFELDALHDFGSKAVEGYMNPEGIVVFHTAGNVGFKRTIKNDETPKSKQ
jgi:hypothetical protein